MRSISGSWTLPCEFPQERPAPPESEADSARRSPSLFHLPTLVHLLAYACPRQRLGVPAFSFACALGRVETYILPPSLLMRAAALANSASFFIREGDA